VPESVSRETGHSGPSRTGRRTHRPPPAAASAALADRRTHRPPHAPAADRAALADRAPPAAARAGPTHLGRTAPRTGHGPQHPLHTGPQAAKLSPLGILDEQSPGGSRKRGAVGLPVH